MRAAIAGCGQVRKREAAVKKGMEGLHGRLQAIELGLAKLPKHLNSFKAQNRELDREFVEHSKQIETIQKAMSDFVLAAPTSHPTGTSPVKEG